MVLSLYLGSNSCACRIIFLEELSVVAMLVAKKACFAVTAIGRHAAGSFKLWRDDTLCELKGQLEDSYESSEGM